MKKKDHRVKASRVQGIPLPAFYAAAHVRAFDETNWDPGVSVQTGFHVKRDQRSSNLRLGLEGYIGRAILGEFALDYDEAYLTAGIFFDFY